VDDIQKRHEYAAGDAFVAWYNLQNRKRFVYDERPREAPDLNYIDGGDVLDVEITDAYYDKNDTEKQRKIAHQKADAPISMERHKFRRSISGGYQCSHVREKF